MVDRGGKYTKNDPLLKDLSDDDSENENDGE
jgi:hypothetical protein